jgi:hypothetical protein
LKEVVSTGLTSMLLGRLSLETSGRYRNSFTVLLLEQAVKADRAVRRRGPHIFYTFGT